MDRGTERQTVRGWDKSSYAESGTDVRGKTNSVISYIYIYIMLGVSFSLHLFQMRQLKPLDSRDPLERKSFSHSLRAEKKLIARGHGSTCFRLTVANPASLRL